MAISDKAIRDILGPRFLSKVIKDLTEEQLIAALQRAPNGIMIQLVRACSKGDRDRAGYILVELIKEYMNTVADAEVNAVIASGALSFELLVELL